MRVSIPREPQLSPRRKQKRNTTRKSAIAGKAGSMIASYCSRFVSNISRLRAGDLNSRNGRQEKEERTEYGQNVIRFDEPTNLATVGVIKLSLFFRNNSNSMLTDFS